MTTPEPMIPTFDASLARAMRTVLDPIAREPLPPELMGLIDRLRRAERVGDRLPR